MNASVNAGAPVKVIKPKMLKVVLVKTNHAPHAHQGRMVLLLWVTSSRGLSQTASAFQQTATLHAMQFMAESGTRISKGMLAQHQERAMVMKKKEKGKRERLENQVLSSSWLGLWSLLPPFSSEFNNGSSTESPLLV